MIQVSIVHDETGRIVSISRPSDDAKVIVLSGAGESVLRTQVDEQQVSELINTHRVDLSRGALAAY